MTARGTRSKLLSRAEACRAVRASKRRKERVVFTNGCFDLLQIRPVRTIEQARRLGDRLLVAINTDASVRALKGRGRPLVPVRQRMEVIAALECVDWVIQFREPTPLSAIRALRPDVLAKGGDWPLARIVGAATNTARGFATLSPVSRPTISAPQALNGIRMQIGAEVESAM